MTTYYIITGIIDGKKEELFGSFNKADCKSEMECERDQWREENYKSICHGSRSTTDTLDPKVYPELFKPTKDETTATPEEMILNNLNHLNGCDDSYDCDKWENILKIALKAYADCHDNIGNHPRIECENVLKELDL